MARISLGWGVRNLARESQIGTATISRLERGQGVTSTTISALTKTFEDHGVKLIADDEASIVGGPGVRLKK
tara:strand:- start:4745 stop:4957 length:213 start_codon:yes stop_codon:yes gene_type:complete